MSNFDRIAPFYDFLAKAVFGKSIRQSQVHFLHQLPEKGNLLVIGGGTGWILEEIIRIRPHLFIDYVEASKRMIQKSMKRPVKSANIHFIHGTEKSIPTRKQYDAIITYFFLDVFNTPQLANVMYLLDKVLAGGGLWFCADFKETDKQAHLFLLKFMHWFFRKVSKLESRRLKDFSRYFKKLHYCMKGEALFYDQMIYSRVYKKRL